MDNTAAIIFSAGKGTRLRPLTENTPKPLLKVTEDKSLIDFTIESLIRTGIQNIFINYSYGEELFMERLSKYSNLCKIHFLPKENEPLGQGGTILTNLALFSEYDQILCSNGDTYTQYDRSIFLESHIKGDSSLTILSDNSKTLPKDVLTNLSNEIIGCRLNHGNYFYSKPFLNIYKRNTYLGEFVFNPKDLKNQEYSNEFRGMFGNDDFIEILRENCKKASVYNDRVERILSMNTLEEYEAVKNVLAGDTHV